MEAYQEFLSKNYDISDKINILRFSARKGSLHNEIWKIGNLQKVAGYKEADCYMSMNPLVVKDKHIKRDKEHVGRLKWLYVDLDFYGSVYKEFTKRQILGLLELDYFGKGIPQPTYVIDSGRGLYLLWRIDEHIKAYSRWVSMQNYLAGQLEEFGADRKVTSDSARVLRCIGSINSKSGTEVHILCHQDVKYSLTSLIRDYVICGKPSEKMVKYARHIAMALDIPAPDVQDRDAVKKFIRENKEPANLFYQQKKGQKQIKKKKYRVLYRGTEYSLLLNRLKDLEKLLTKYRDKEGGCREHILFLYRYWQICITDSLEEGLSRTLELNGKLRHPLEQREVVQATASAEKYYLAGKIFRPSNQYVVDALKISDEEMLELSVFVSGKERQKRKQTRNKKNYLDKLKKMGKLTKEEQIRRRRSKVYKLLKKNYTAEEICQEMNISRATFYADKQCIERYFATKKKCQEKQMNQYREYCKKMEEKCLKISAFVLNMSFRTWPGLFQFPQVQAVSVFFRRFLRTDLMDYMLCRAAPWREYSLSDYLTFGANML